MRSYGSEASGRFIDFSIMCSITAETSKPNRVRCVFRALACLFRYVVMDISITSLLSDQGKASRSKGGLVWPSNLARLRVMLWTSRTTRARMQLQYPVMVMRAATAADDTRELCAACCTVLVVTSRSSKGSQCTGNAYVTAGDACQCASSVSAGTEFYREQNHCVTLDSEREVSIIAARNTCAISHKNDMLSSVVSRLVRSLTSKIAHVHGIFPLFRA